MLDASEAFAVAQGLYKALAAAVKTGEEGNLRALADAASRDLYEREGSKTRELRVGGAKVGTMTLTVKEQVWRGGCGDEEALFWAWAREHGLLVDEVEVDLSRLPDDARKRAVEILNVVAPDAVVRRKAVSPAWDAGLVRAPGGALVDADGQVVPGCGWELKTSTSARGCEPADVAQAMDRAGISVADVLRAAAALPAAEGEQR